MHNNPLEERQLQDNILNDLVATQGYRLHTMADYDTTYALDTTALTEFLEQTQQTRIAAFKKEFGDTWIDRIKALIDAEVEEKGLVDVLRSGINRNGYTFDITYLPTHDPQSPLIVPKHAKNIFSVIEEVRYAAEGRTDLVLFLNGLPLTTVELKSNYAGQTHRHAIKQYKNDRDPNQKLFRYNERCIVHFAVDFEECHMTTRLQGEDTVFFPFNKGRNGGSGNPINEQGIDTDYLWKDLFSKKTWLYVIQSLLLITEDKGLVFPRYHQLDAVRSLGHAIRQPDAQHKFLIQHSPGSGKSYTIAWLAHLLFRIGGTNGGKCFKNVIVLSDRCVINNQLQKDVSIAGIDKNVVLTVKKAADLKKALKDGSKIIVTTIQMFKEVVSQLEMDSHKQFQHAVIIDEGHSSTSGEYMSTLKKALSPEENTASNVKIITFTATPRDTTLAIYGNNGEPFHCYTMTQAIEEGFILDVLKNYITIDTACEISQIKPSDPNMPENPKVLKGRTTKNMAAYVHSHTLTIQQKAEIIMDHFCTVVKPLIGGKAKAMIVANSRQSARQYFQIINKLIEEQGLDFKALVAFSGKLDKNKHDKNKPDTECTINGIKKSSLITELFKEDDYKILIVAEKYLTGFNQPLLAGMYIDKVLKGLNAVQTITRINRVYKDKEEVYILNLRNSASDISNAFELYMGKTTCTNEVTPEDLDSLYTQLYAHGILQVDAVRKFASLFHTAPDKRTDNMLTCLEILKLSEKKLCALVDIEQQQVTQEINKYLQVYNLLQNYTEMDNPEYESLAIFLKCFKGHIKKEILEDIDVSQYVQVDKFEIVGSKTTTIIPQCDGQMTLEYTSKDITPPKIDIVSNIIEELSARLKGASEHQWHVGDMIAELKGNEPLIALAKFLSMEVYIEAITQPVNDMCVSRAITHRGKQFYQELLVNDKERLAFTALIGKYIHREQNEDSYAEEATGREQEQELVAILVEDVELHGIVDTVEQGDAMEHIGEKLLRVLYEKLCSEQDPYYANVFQDVQKKAKLIDKVVPVIYQKINDRPRLNVADYVLIALKDLGWELPIWSKEDLEPILDTLMSEEAIQKALGCNSVEQMTDIIEEPLRVILDILAYDNLDHVARTLFVKSAALQQFIGVVAKVLAD